MAWKIFTQLQTDDEITNEFLTSLLDEFENQWKNSWYFYFVAWFVIVFFSSSNSCSWRQCNYRGKYDPLQYSEELYVVRVTPADESRDIQFNVYSRIGKISSQEQNIPRGVNYVNFYLKFFPPLYKIDEKYTLEVVGGGLIGRSTLTIIQDPSVIDSQKWKNSK